MYIRISYRLKLSGAARGRFEASHKLIKAASSSSTSCFLEFYKPLPMTLCGSH